MAALSEQLSTFERDVPLLQCRRNVPFQIARRCAETLPSTFPKEAHLLRSYEQRTQYEREQRVNRIREFLLHGRDSLTLELGCHTGQMTLALQEATGGQVVAIDRDATLISRAAERIGDRPHINLHSIDFLNWHPPTALVEKNDQIVASHFLHEVFSEYGESGYREAIDKCKALLAPGGRLILLDGVCPWEDAVSVRFRDQETRAQLDRFQAIYQARSVQFDVVDRRACRMDASVLACFLNTLKFVIPENLAHYESAMENVVGAEQRAARAFFFLEYYTRPQSDFKSELQQDFTFFSQDQWCDSLREAGLNVQAVETYNERQTEGAFWASGLKLDNLPGGTPQIRIRIVAEKGA